MLTPEVDFVVHLVTAADGAEQHYTTVNNSIRTETPEEARILDKKTLDAWNDHPGRILAPNGDGRSSTLSALDRMIQSMISSKHA